MTQIQQKLFPPKKNQHSTHKRKIYVRPENLRTFYFGIKLIGSAPYNSGFPKYKY